MSVPHTHGEPVMDRESFITSCLISQLGTGTKTCRLRVTYIAIANVILKNVKELCPDIRFRRASRIKTRKALTVADVSFSIVDSRVYEKPGLIMGITIETD